jgi:hypothetical protein
MFINFVDNRLTIIYLFHAKSGPLNFHSSLVSERKKASLAVKHARVGGEEEDDGVLLCSGGFHELRRRVGSERKNPVQVENQILQPV